MNIKQIIRLRSVNVDLLAYGLLWVKIVSENLRFQFASEGVNRRFLPASKRGRHHSGDIWHVQNRDAVLPYLDFTTAAYGCQF